MRTRSTITAMSAAALAVAAGLTFIQHASAAPAAGHNGRIAYSKTVSGNVDVYTIKADGTSQLRLTTAAGADSMPAYSASGQQMVYVRQPSSTVRELWTMNADGSAKRKVTTLNTAQTCPPQFSPDGKRIAFTQSVSGKRRIWTVAVNGSTKRQAFTPPASQDVGSLINAQDDCAKWSPRTGAGLAYIRTWHQAADGDSSPEIRINTGTGDRIIVGMGEGWTVGALDFDPTGQQIVYSTCSAGGCSFAEYGLVIVDLRDAGGEVVLTTSELSFGPAWSPDGRYVAVGADDGVHLVRVDRGGSAWLRVETQRIYSLSWQPVK